MATEIDLRRARALFDAVLELPPDARTPYLLRECTDPQMLEYIERLLFAHAQQTASGQRLAQSIVNAIHEASATEVTVGDRLGSWRLIGELGSGGMGAVFLAEREDGHFKQRAAVKVLHGIASHEAMTRLADERQILATLNHPNIARLLDGGATPAGRPFLVMEQIEGLTLDRYLNEHAPGLVPRLELFRQICAPVSHAHTKLIVHCDLKPSNILITAESRPVLLDFGIARLLDPLGTSSPEITANLPHTPGYASPELRFGGRIGTGVDVYALGVVLSGMLAAPPDTDLRAIIGKATAEQDADRYASVAELVGDIDHYLSHRPVIARAANPGYRLQKFLRRRWLAVSVMTGILLLSAGFSLQLWRERDRALAAESAALREAETARATTQFLQDVFRGADLDEGGGRQTTALSLVDRGRERIRTALDAEPRVQLRLLGSLADVYDSLGEPAEAETLLGEAIAKARALAPPDPESLAQLLVRHSHLLADRNRHAEGESSAREAVLLAQHLAGAEQATSAMNTEAALTRAKTLPASRLQIDAMSALAEIETGLQHSKSAQGLLDLVLQQRTQLHDPPEGMAMTWYAIAEDQLGAGSLEPALSGFQRVYQTLLASLGPDHPRTLSAQQEMAITLARQEHLTEAESIMREVLARRLALHGPRSAQVATIQTELAFLLNQQGHYLASVRFHEQVLAHDAAVQGEQSPVYARTLNNLAFAYMNMGDAKRSIDAFQRSIAIREATLPAGDLAIARAQNNLARFLLSLGHVDEARPLVNAALQTRQAQLATDNEECIESKLSAQELARRSGDLAKAQALWTEVEPHLGKIHPYTQLEAARARAWLAVAAHEPDAAKRISAYIDGLRATLGEANPAILRGQVAEAEMRLALGERDAALQLARELKARFHALTDAYPPDSLFFARLDTVIKQAQGPEQR
ncbi:hypothetical protein C7S18_00815 [Ahniella affigens]|uniref:Protein kinase domain-containing protein n=1 Tax=Ahniella affigens TaxID=2021234 RepID=A0A2P1PLW1_9GAMM|nr:serine/threonine-protein kinase [Ahniella affigens]AVP95828.1 hypothetical protein C7S18_00815 [Ahniella affigens]